MCSEKADLMVNEWPSAFENKLIFCRLSLKNHKTKTFKTYIYNIRIIDSLYYRGHW